MRGINVAEQEVDDSGPAGDAERLEGSLVEKV